jgi:hypothetical protein
VARDYRKEAQAESLAQKARKSWYQDRVQIIHSRVSAFDVLRDGGVPLKQSSDNQPEQFSCPFHGRDENPSARVYPEDANGPSHAWCFVCQERWDSITLWRKFHQMEEQPFPQVLSAMERSYGLETPALPAEAALNEGVSRSDSMWEAFKALYEVCEIRLCSAHMTFKHLDDRDGYLRLGIVLDKLRHKATQRSIRPDEAQKVLRKVLDKIGEKERKCPVG